MRHEFIHWRQYCELCFVGFVALYLLGYAVLLARFALFDVPWWLLWRRREGLPISSAANVTTQTVRQSYSAEATPSPARRTPPPPGAGEARATPRRVTVTAPPAEESRQVPSRRAAPGAASRGRSPVDTQTHSVGQYRKSAVVS